MATVIYGQPDTRFEQLGKGLGQLGGAVFQGLQLQETAKGVAEIMQDQSIADNDKPVQALKKYGQIGYELFNQQLKQKATQATITGELARAKLADVQSARGAAGLPFVAPQAEAQVGATQAGTARTQAETEKTKLLLPGEVQAQTVQNVLGQQRALLTEKETDVAGAEARLKGAQATRYEQILSGLGTQASPQTLDKMLDDAGVQDPTSRAAAKQAYAAQAYSLDPSKAPEAFAKAITGIATARERGRIQAEKPSEAETKYAADSNEHAASAQRYIDYFSKGGAEKIGFGAQVPKFLETHGIPTGNEEINQMWIAAYQQVASTATTGGGFFAQGRVRLANDVTPTISETPLHAIIAADQVADRQLANLRVRLQDHPEQKSLQTAIASWEKVKQNTGSLQSFTMKDPQGNDKTVMQYNGNAIDPKTFKVNVRGSAQYVQPNGAKGSGADIIQKAFANGLDPLDVIAQYQLKEVK